VHARYAVLQTKKLFKIKANMLYIDRSHISKGAGDCRWWLQITQLTPDRIAMAAMPRAGRACAGNHTTFVPEVSHEEAFYEQRHFDHEERNETSTNKLKLARETLRYLSAPELARVEGGDVAATYTCYPTCIETKI
jgi:hypothetical protein